MKTAARLCLLIFPSLLLVQSLHAQTTEFFIPNITIDPSTTIDVQVKVKNFNSIVTTQFSLDWNPEALQFLSVDDFGLDNISLLDNFGTTFADEGALGFLWEDVTFQGVTVPDSSTIFSVQFEVIGEPGQASFINFSDFPTFREVADTSFSPIQTIYTSGAITILGPSSTQEQKNIKDFEISGPFPNPFVDDVRIHLKLKSPANINFTVYDANGKPLHTQNTLLGVGQQTVTLSKKLFPLPGIYFLKLNSEDFLITRKLISLQYNK